MLPAGGLGRYRTTAADTPVELRFVDMLMIVIATLMLVAVILSITSAFTGSGRADVAPKVTTDSLPTALSGQPYDLRLAAVGGDGTYTWRLAGGVLPEGLSLAQDGVIRGSARRPGATQLRVEVQDGQQRRAQRELAMTVRSSGAVSEPQHLRPRVAAPAIALPDAAVGKPYQYRFDGEIGTPPYAWSIGTGRLPTGLHLSADGNLNGRPDHDGIAAFQVRMTDSTGESITQDIRLTVRSGPTSPLLRVLGWLKTLVMLFGILMILTFLGFFIFGMPPSTSPGVPPVWKRWR